MKILELLREEGSAKVSYLSQLFGVSEPTIRQDLEALEREGSVVREHGGAYLKSLTRQVRTMTLEHTEHLKEKRRIAETAAGLVEAGATVILDSGSTTTEIAKLLVGVDNLTVVTNALNIALILGSSPNVTVHVTGGEFKAPTLSLTGDTAAAFLDKVKVDVLFLASGGIDEGCQLTYPGFQDLSVKRAMINVARHTYLVVDSSKFGKASLARLGPVSMVDAVITDSGLASETRKQLEAQGVQVILAG